jgi:glutamyl-tRNA synthetase
VNLAINLNPAIYRGRLAPSPTGYLHLGHAKTFWTAQERARRMGGVLVLRNDDLDRARCRPEFVQSMLEDLQWFGLQWSEGPDRNGPCAPYNQSERMGFYRSALDQLRAGGFLYPCTCSRKDVLSAAAAPHVEDDEPIYPGTCRSRTESDVAGKKFSWRFRVPDGETIVFDDVNLGTQSFVAGQDFGDFVVWRHDGVPAYQLACVVDDTLMSITEVVRGADLLASTARQLLIYRAMGCEVPRFFHCELMRDGQGRRLAKRHDSLSLRQLRAQNIPPETLRKHW